MDFIVTSLTRSEAADQTLLVSNGFDFSTSELVCGLAKAARVPRRLMPTPVWVLQMLGRLFDKANAMQRLCGNLQVDISKVSSLLRWVPPITVKDGLHRAVTGMKIT